MKENKTLADLYQISPRHDFGDISLTIENQGGKLRGKFIFHPIASDNATLEKTLSDNKLPVCFGRPPMLVAGEVMSDIVWDERYKTLGEVIPLIEKNILEFGRMVSNLGERLVMCAQCPVFERCYRIAEFNLQRKQVGAKVEGRWTI